MKTRTVATLKWIGYIVIALAVVYAVLLGFSNRRLAQAYARLEADGLPMQIEQIIPPPVSDPDNAALIYRAAVLQLKSEKVDQQDLFTQMGNIAAEILKGTNSPSTIDSFRQLLHRKGVPEALQAIAEGSLKPACRYDLDYTKGAVMLLPHLAELRGLSRILCATARLQAIDGDPAGAWDTAITSLRVANAVKSCPILISQLVRIAQFSITTETLQSLCSGTRPTALQAATIQELLATFDDSTPFVRTMDGERLLLGEWCFKQTQGEIPFDGDISSGPLFLVQTFKPLFNRDHAAYLELMHAAAKNAYIAYSPGELALEQQLFINVPRYCVMTKMLVPALATTKDRYISMIAQARITRAGFAALQYQQQQGHYPADFAAMGMDGLLDPYSGKPLFYQATPTGFTIYSVGTNQIDDKGTKGKDRKSGDIAWLYSEK